MTVALRSRRPRPAVASLISTILIAAVTPAVAPGSVAAAPGALDVSATVETDPVANRGDAADDPAIWRHPNDPARSVVIGNDKLGALEVYDMDGDRIQRITGGFFGNVDVRQGVAIGGRTRDLVVVWRGGIRVFTIDPVSRRLTNITEGGGSIAVRTGGEGLCLYRDASAGRTFAIAISRPGVVAQYELLDADRDGRIEGQLRRSWSMGSESEGCVADDGLGHLYVSQEDTGVWKYGAGPTDPTGTGARELVEGVRSRGGRIRADAEGLTIVYRPDGRGYLIVSSQAASDTANSYLVYEREGGNDFVREFQVETGSVTDGCGRTDGIDALAADLGPGFRQGVFVCQDGSNTAPAPGRQNFKFVPLERVVPL